MANPINNQISFNSKFNLILLNFSIFSLLTDILINSDKNENTILIAILTAFIANSFLILFFLNWILKRLAVHYYRLKGSKTGLDILDIISRELNLSIQNIEGNIFYTSYYYKRPLGDKIFRDAFIILEGKRIFLNIKNQNDSIYIYKEDFTEKQIKRILSENAQLTILNENTM